MYLIPAQPIDDHARLVMEWRNDPLTLSMSFNQTPKIWENFRDEFKDTYFTHPQLPPLLGMVEEVPIGFIRFRLYDHPLPSQFTQPCDISVMISPLQRGKGYGTELVKQSTAYIHKLGWVTVVAEILAVNQTSIRLFERNNYHFLDEISRNIHTLAVLTPVLRYVHQQ